MSTDSTPMRILFLSSDTGGGHRASAESLGAQFEKIFPGSTYELLDIVKEHSSAPFNGLESWYQHLSSNPKQWNMVYKISNSPPVERIVKTHLKLTTERSVRKRILSHEPDVVISVHPLMNNVPVTSCAKISSETGRHLPMFTVVTDLGSGHCTWFDNGVEKMFIGSARIKELAMKRGKVPEDKIELSGLPIRHDFAMQADFLGEEGRSSLQGNIHQLQTRKKLGIIADAEDETYRKVILVMGGGEGVGSLSSIVDALYLELKSKNIVSTIVVICGRNIVLKESFEQRDWNNLMLSLETKDTDTNLPPKKKTGIISKFTTSSIEMLSKKGKQFLKDRSGSVDEIDEQCEEEKKQDGNDLAEIIPQQESQVKVEPLGFITNMAEYMVAADVLVTKAGPGTIAEAASVGLPVMLTSFLPGQEEGNVDFVLEKKFGEYRTDAEPNNVASGVSSWLQDPDLMVQMSNSARDAGNPNAARDIVQKIGTSVLRWKEHHPNLEIDAETNK